MVRNSSQASSSPPTQWVGVSSLRSFLILTLGIVTAENEEKYGEITPRAFIEDSTFVQLRSSEANLKVY